jgi:hypothetical protein
MYQGGRICCPRPSYAGQLVAPVVAGLPCRVRARYRLGQPDLHDLLDGGDEHRLGDACELVADGRRRLGRPGSGRLRFRLHVTRTRRELPRDCLDDSAARRPTPTSPNPYRTADSRRGRSHHLPRLNATLPRPNERATCAESEQPNDECYGHLGPFRPNERDTDNRALGAARTSQWFATHSACSPRAVGRLHYRDDGQSSSARLNLGRRAIASLEHRTTGLPRIRSSATELTDDCVW